MLVAYLLMVGSGLRIAARAEHAFDKLLAVGLTTLLGVQAFIIIGGVIRVLPLTGVTLPFVSYGGSSLVSNYDPARPAAADLRREPPPGAPRRSAMAVGVNSQIRRLGIGLIVCYVALFVQLNWIQVVHKDELDNNANNTIGVKQDFNQPRGTITTADGALLAQSVEQPDRQRVHLPAHVSRGRPVRPDHRLLLVPPRRQRAGEDLQRRAGRPDDQPAGRAASPTCSSTRDRRSATSPSRCARTCSRWPATRSATARARSSRSTRKTGEILAFWSFPSYDPNLISSNDLDAAEAAYDALLNGRRRSRCGPHQYQERYFPGSTFKVVTGSIGVEHRRGHRRRAVATRWRPATRRRAPTKPISNFGGESCGGTLFPILAGVVQLGVRPDGRRDDRPRRDDRRAPRASASTPSRRSTCRRRSRSSFPTDFTRNLPALAQSSIGQNDVQATPLQMALVAAAVANGGKIMTPHVMQRGPRQRGRRRQALRRRASGCSRSARTTAATMRQAMIGVVAARHRDPACRSPASRSAARPAPPSSAPTRRASHAWIIGFAGPPGDAAGRRRRHRRATSPAAARPTGGRVAAPIAQAGHGAGLPSTPVGTTATDAEPWPSGLHAGAATGRRSLG